MNVAVTTAAIGANEHTTFVHTGPNGEGWSAIVKYGPRGTLRPSAVPGLSIRLDEID
jgi:hypothetical protein